MPDNNDSDLPYEYKLDGPPSIAIVKAIAEIKGTDPAELDLILYDYIDTEALNRICGSNGVQVSFKADQYKIQVTDSKKVQIWP